MADTRTRIINLPEATTLDPSMNFVEDSADGSGTRRITYDTLKGAINQEGAVNLAPAYSNAATYNVGDLCTYQGTLYSCVTQISTAEDWTPAHWTAVNMSREVSQLKSDLKELTILYKSDSVLNKFDVRIFDDDIGYSPQGLAVWGNTAFVSNGVTAPLNVITEIDLISGQYTQHTVSGLNNGANCLAIDYKNSLLYAADHGKGGVFHEIDMNTWEVVNTYDVSAVTGGANIAYDPFEDCFYVLSIPYSKLYKFNKSFSLMESIDIETTDSTKYPTHNAGTAQGLGYDGTFFYVMRSEVEAIYGNSIVIVYNKSGKIVTYFNGDHDEIEDISYDFSTGKYFVCYAKVNTGYISQYVDDTGWLNLYDYLSGSYSAKTSPDNIGNASTAKFRIYNGTLMFKGDLIVNAKASGMTNVATYIDARISAPSDQHMRLMLNANNALTPLIVTYPFFNQYIAKFKQPYLPLYATETGTFTFANNVPFGLQIWE